MIHINVSHLSGADPGFPLEMAPALRGGGMAPTYDFAKNCMKLRSASVYAMFMLSYGAAVLHTVG